MQFTLIYILYIQYSIYENSCVCVCVCQFTQGLLKRCIEYEFSQELLDLGLPSSSLPQDRCVSMTDLDCSQALTPLISGHDLLNHTEIHNTHDTDRCNES